MIDGIALISSSPPMVVMDKALCTCAWSEVELKLASEYGWWDELDRGRVYMIIREMGRYLFEVEKPAYWWRDLIDLVMEKAVDRVGGAAVDLTYSYEGLLLSSASLERLKVVINYYDTLLHEKILETDKFKELDAIVQRELESRDPRG